MRRLVRALFFANGALWLALAGASLARVAQGGADQPAILWATAILMVGNAAAFVVVGLGLGTSRRRLFFWSGIALLSLNIVLSVTDQVGALDLATLGFDLILLLLLIAAERPPPA